ncbi:hypothetical protein ACNG34_002686 [Enterococcus faecium]|nr:hypothetical protein [Enterococcus faecium]
MTEKENVVWHFERNPHMLITGRTATGKTYLLKRMADYLSQIGIVSASFDKYEFERSLYLIQEEFEERYEYIREYSDGKSGATYTDLVMRPYFVLIDELDTRLLLLEKEAPLAYDCLLKIIKDIVLKGRVVGIFLIAVRQGSQSFLEPIEDNMVTRIFLGYPKGNGTIFVDGDTKKFQTELVTEDFFFADH